MAPAGELGRWVAPLCAFRRLARLPVMPPRPWCIRRPAAVGALALLGACAGAEAPAVAVDSLPRLVGCTADARPGVVLAVEDARTGAPLSGYALWLRREAPGAAPAALPVDSAMVTAPPPAPWAGALEQPGRYALRVAKAGYRAWDSTGIVVTSDACHVRTVHLRVRLRPG